MSEIIFILIILYAVYVIKKSCSEKKETGLDFLVSDVPASQAKASTAAPAKKAEKPAAKKVKEKPAAKAKPAQALSDGKKIPQGSLRNPETGVEDKIANSYRMCKRWIKEALVTEGLLDKVYKSSEVDDAKKIEINLAIEKLLQLDKYR